MDLWGGVPYIYIYICSGCDDGFEHLRAPLPVNRCSHEALPKPQRSNASPCRRISRLAQLGHFQSWLGILLRLMVLYTTVVASTSIISTKRRRCRSKNAAGTSDKARPGPLCKDPNPKPLSIAPTPHQHTAPATLALSSWHYSTAGKKYPFKKPAPAAAGSIPPTLASRKRPNPLEEKVSLLVPGVRIWVAAFDGAEIRLKLKSGPLRAKHLHGVALLQDPARPSTPPT